MTLDVRNITMRFAGLTALDDVSMAIERSEIVGLIGPNGSGKTTLLNVISGVLTPTDGTVSVDGHAWTSSSPRRVARLGVRRTFQNIRLFDEMTALETVEVPGAALGGQRSRRDIALNALEQLRLGDHRDRIADQLPYGLQRRLEIARAIAGEPRFLLLDEPTAGLNDTESDALVDMILAIRDRHGCGVVLIDHDLRVIMSACSRIIVLNEGAVISEGKPHHVRSDPAVVKAYLG